MFAPKYTVSQIILNKMLEIERSRVIVDQLALPAGILEELKKEFKETTVLLSTRMEGNDLDEEIKRQFLYKTSNNDQEQEVYNLMKAMEFLDESEASELIISEEWIKKLHAIIRIDHGQRIRLSEYRTEQNRVGNRNISGFYLPPEYMDVPTLMEDFVAWINYPQMFDVPAPIKAGIAMWQLLTIHPYMDGNGRISRIIASYILHRGGYGLKGLLVLEVFYDRNLIEYYKALQMGLSHNYYFGRHNADITVWLEYFFSGLSEVYSKAALIVQEKTKVTNDGT